MSDSVYLSTITNPSLHKASKSTKDQSEPSRPRPNRNPTNACLVYDFEFGTEELVEEEERNNEEDSEFERERRRVERENFHKEPPKLGFSDDECRIDDL